MKIIQVFWLILTIGFLVSCGGGGGGGNDPPASGSTPTLYPMQEFDPRSPAYGHGATLVGADSDGNAYSATWSVVARAPFLLAGDEIIPVEQLITVTAGGPSDTLLVTAFYDNATGNNIGTLVRETGVECTTTAQGNQSNESVKIGDFGTGATASCSDSTTITASWVVTAGPESTALLKLIGKTTNLDGTVIATNEITYTITPSGAITHIEMTIYLPQTDTAFAFTGSVVS